MMSGPISFKSARNTSAFSLFLSLLFFAFFTAAKQLPSLHAVNPFQNDPYDATGSFGIQLSMFCALFSVARLVFYNIKHSTDSSGLVLSLRASTLSLLAITITLFSDSIAMIRFTHLWAGHTSGLVLFFLSAVFFIVALVSLAIIVKNANREAASRLPMKAIGLGIILFVTLYFYPTFSSPSQWVAIANIIAGIVVLLAPVLVIKKDLLPMQLPIYDDALDWLFAIIHKTPHVENERKIRGIIKRCAVWIALVIGVAAGMLLIFFEFSTEGAPSAKTLLKVIAVYVGFEACVIVLCFALFNRFLGIIKKE